MTNTNKIILAAFLGGIAVFALVALVDVDVSGDMEMPHVEMTGGQMPRVDMNTADVNVGTGTTKVDVPTGINVETEQREVEYPTIDVDMPKENDTN